ncbi:hypothetical protein SCNRRL3882_0140 [Streptomyces chartreusis NRRL 3882]|uniref:Uncharacterized protein n=2 Tax=Streptomyces chartreusis TaxID=1969 RepID=A0A2N9B000_STRCX|nr:hypothetical protein SCNRRL3882_0140 [Streptomyces chartreusis NRRL 3882]
MFPDRELYLPEHSWTADRKRCRQAGIPKPGEKPDTAARQRRQLQLMSLAETRRLFNLIGRPVHEFRNALHWSTFRRHQVEARRHHFRRRMRLRMMRI